MTSPSEKYLIYEETDRRLTPYRTSLTVGDHVSDIIGAWLSDVVPESTGPSEKMIDTASAFYLKGEGTSVNKEEDKKSESGNKDKHFDRIISNVNYSSNPKNTVSVFGPDKKRLKNTNISRAKKWIKQNKARQVKDKSRPDAFAIQLITRPIGNIRVPVLIKR